MKLVEEAPLLEMWRRELCNSQENFKFKMKVKNGKKEMKAEESL